MTWHYHTSGGSWDEALEVGGIRVWRREWIPLDDQYADVILPDGRPRRLPLYAIHDGERAVHVAAGEVSNNVFVFFAESPPPLDLLWKRTEWRARLKRTVALTIALSATPIFAILAIFIWRDGDRRPAAFVAAIGALLVADAVFALRRKRWPRLLRVWLRFEE